MTDTYFTVSDDPDEYNRRTVEIHDGRKMSGRAYVRTSWQPAEGNNRDRHVVMVELGRHLNDENGRTVYRAADPTADEVNTGVMPSDHNAIIARPVRVNGIAYSGTLYLEREHDNNGDPAGSWRMQGGGYVNRADDYFGNVTDAAHKRLHGLITDLAEEIVTDETVKWDRVRVARREVDDAERKVREAEAELETARKTAREAINAYEAMAAHS